jgi:hypothetical protein
VGAFDGLDDGGSFEFIISGSPFDNYARLKRNFAINQK